MNHRPQIITVMVVIQLALIGIDLLMPFVSPSLANLGTFDFLMAYGFAVLDLILAYGFWNASRWAWFFGLIYSGLQILNYVLLYFENGYLFYAIPLFLRLIVMLSIRGNKMKDYFGMSGSRI